MSIVRQSERIEKVPARSGWIVGDTEVTESLPAVRSGAARFTGSLACTPQ